jgi:hypothetical protein
MDEKKGVGARAARPASKSKAVAATAAKPPRKAAPAKSGRPDKATAAEAAPVDRFALVQLAAYVRAERRGFAPGHELADWLAAEAEVAATLAKKPPAKPATKPGSKASPRPRAR